jgi:hypothetical protein
MSNPSSSAKTTESPDGQDPVTFGGRVTVQIGAGMSSAALGWESCGFHNLNSETPIPESNPNARIPNE